MSLVSLPESSLEGYLNQRELAEAKSVPLGLNHPLKRLVVELLCLQREIGQSNSISDEPSWPAGHSE